LNAPIAPRGFSVARRQTSSCTSSGMRLRGLIRWWNRHLERTSRDGSDAASRESQAMKGDPSLAGATRAPRGPCVLRAGSWAGELVGARHRALGVGRGVRDPWIETNGIEGAASAAPGEGLSQRDGRPWVIFAHRRGQGSISPGQGVMLMWHPSLVMNRLPPEELPNSNGDEIEEDERQCQGQHGERIRARRGHGRHHRDDDDGPAPRTQETGGRDDPGQFQ
jgi:hypothetical protein